MIHDTIEHTVVTIHDVVRSPSVGETRDPRNTELRRPTLAEVGIDAEVSGRPKHVWRTPGPHHTPWGIMWVENTCLGVA